MSQLVCNFKKRCGRAQCRQYIRDPAKQPEVHGGVEWRNCVSCLKVRVKNPWSTIANDLIPGLKKAMDDAEKKDGATQA